MRIPLVSIIVPTYRRTSELRSALCSLRNLLYENFEVIIVDDNDDGEWNRVVKKIVDDFIDENAKIPVAYLENHPNLGSARTRNVGINSAKGEYVCFLDDDDIYLPSRINNQVFAMEENDADYSLTNLALYSEENKLIETRNRIYIKETTKERLLEYHMKYHMTGTDTMMFKREYLNRIGAFDAIDIGDEFYLMQKAIENDGKFLYVPVCDVKAYVHTGEGGLSSGKGKIRGENQLYEYKKKYFPQLDKKTVRYIKMRHYMVLAYAHFRMHNYVDFFIEGIKACFFDVRGCIGIVLGEK